MRTNHDAKIGYGPFGLIWAKKWANQITAVEWAFFVKETNYNVHTTACSKIYMPGPPALRSLHSFSFLSHNNNNMQENNQAIEGRSISSRTSIQPTTISSSRA
jgi:hypothetical protein